MQGLAAAVLFIEVHALFDGLDHLVSTFVAQQGQQCQPCNRFASLIELDVSLTGGSIDWLMTCRAWQHQQC